MKIAKILFVTVAFISTVSAARAEHDWSWNWNDRFAYTHEGDRFLPQEFNLDLFGSYRWAEGKGSDLWDSADSGVWGGGIGANYFFTRYVGVGADVSMHADGGKFIDNTSGNVILRLPIDAASLAPYVFGGFGGNFDPETEWEGHVGVGLEFRLNPKTGIFMDGRVGWADKTEDFAQVRSGLRLAF